MSPTFFVAAGVVAVLVAGIIALRSWSRHVRESTAERDLGVVSTRWISELRRDEPWGGS
jgi:hypothetical protein